MTGGSFCFNFFDPRNDEKSHETQSDEDSSHTTAQEQTAPSLKQDPSVEVQHYPRLFFFHPEDPRLSNRLYEEANEWLFHRQTVASELFKDWPEKKRNIKNICKKQRKTGLRRLRQKNN